MGSTVLTQLIRIPRRLFHVVALYFLLSFGVMAVADPPDDTVESTTDAESTSEAEPKSDDESIDEITVTGQGSVTSFRNQMFRAEDAFFDLFNQLTTEEDFEIVCERRRRHSFTRTTERYCESRFESRIAFELTQRNINLGSVESAIPVPLQGEYERQVKKRRDDQLKEMERVLLENPELQQKLIELNEAKAKYEEAKSK
ncbi:MAG: hypothetical protein AAFM91_13410 [Pseudomonadota bacterium]